MTKHVFVLVLALSLAATALVAQPPVRELDVIVVLHPDAVPGSVPGIDALTLRARNQGVARGLAAEHGLVARQTYGTVLKGFSARVSEVQLAALRADPRVSRVAYDGVAYGLAKPGGGDPPPPPVQVVPWGIARVGADTVSNTGAGIHVYVLDSGIDSDHPDLQANIDTNGWAGYTCKGSGSVCVYPWDDDYGHGTHVSGTIAAIDDAHYVVGVAPGVTLHPVKVLSKSNSGAWSIIAGGIDWAAADMAARGEVAVANFSIGGSGSKDGECTDTGYTGSHILYEALCNARNMGLIVAISAGNSGADAETAIPAAYDDVGLVVSATLEGDDWIDWSNWGDNTASWTPYASSPVAIAAPGVAVLSTMNDGGLASWNGTSMATPHVTGAVALWLVNNPQTMDSSAFRNARAAILAAAEDTAGFSNTSGNPHAEPFLDVRGF